MGESGGGSPPSLCSFSSKLACSKVFPALPRGFTAAGPGFTNTSSAWMVPSSNQGISCLCLASHPACSTWALCSAGRAAPVIACNVYMRLHPALLLRSRTPAHTVCVLPSDKEEEQSLARDSEGPLWGQNDLVWISLIPWKSNCLEKVETLGKNPCRQ